MEIVSKRILVVADSIPKGSLKELCRKCTDSVHSFLPTKSGRTLDKAVTHLVYLNTYKEDIDLRDVISKVDVADEKYLAFTEGFAYADPVYDIIPPVELQLNRIKEELPKTTVDSNIGVFILCHSAYLPFLESAITSIERQSLQPAERLIVLNDCKMPEMLRGRGWTWLEGVWENPNDARTAAFRKLKSKWIVPLDADDFFEDAYIEEMQEVINRESVKDSNLAIIYPDVLVKNIKLEQLSRVVAPTFNYWELRKNNYISTSSAWRRDVVLNSGGWEAVPYYDDWALALKLTSLGCTGVNKSGCSVVTRKHDRNRSDLIRINKGSEIVWSNKSFAIITIFDNAKYVNTFVDWLKEEDFPLNTSLYVIDSTKDSVLLTHLQRKLSVKQVSNKFLKISCIKIKQFNNNPQSLCNTYNKILPSITEDVVVFRSANILGLGLKDLVTSLTPYSRRAAISAAVAAKEGNDEIRASSSKLLFQPIAGFLGFEDPIRIVQAITGDFSVWDNYYLRKCLPLKVIGEKQEWYMGASVTCSNNSATVNLCGDVKCSFKDGITTPAYESEFSLGDVCKDTAVIVAHYGKKRDGIILQAVKSWGEQIPNFKTVIVELLFPGEVSEITEIDKLKNVEHIIVKGTKQNRNLFQKESLLNIGVKHCSEYEHLIFADSDVISKDKYWFDKIRTKLKQDVLNLVQGFRFFQDTGDGLQERYSYGSQSTGTYLAPGLIWGINKKFFEMMGGFNQMAISGSGDVLFVTECTHPGLSQRYKYLFEKNKWPSEVLRKNTPKGNLTYVPVDVKHIYHGSQESRSYIWSRRVVDQFGSILDNVCIDDTGLLAWTEKGLVLSRVLGRRAELLSEELMLKIIEEEEAKPKFIYKDIFGYFNYEKLFDRMVEGHDSKVPGHFVELGCFLGKSTSYLASTIALSGKDIKLDAIDIFKKFLPEYENYSYLASFKGDSFAAFLENTDSVSEYINPIKAASLDAVLLYKDKSLDFVFIDTEHSYENVKAEITAWLPKICLGGYIGGHDYETSGKYGVKKAVDEIFGDKVEVMDNSWLFKVEE